MDAFVLQGYLATSARYLFQEAPVTPVAPLQVGKQTGKARIFSFIEDAVRSGEANAGGGMPTLYGHGYSGSYV